MTLPPRFLVVTCPVQGHINPSLQFSKRLSAAAGGASVTFVTTVSAHRRMSSAFTDHPSISFAPFSDGNDDGLTPGENQMSEFSRRGSQAISDLIAGAAAEERPYTCLVYTIILPWAGIAADKLGLRSFLLWIQPATVFDIYYHYFHGYEDILRSTTAESKTTLPGLSLKLNSGDIPSFMDASDTHPLVLELFREQFEVLDAKKDQRILVNTFDELESEALIAVAGVELIGIGPLIPSAFLDGKDPSDTSFGGDLFKRSNDDDRIVEWLNSNPKGSVIYVSFGSLSVISKPQMEEIGKALLSRRNPFLWVIRESAKNGRGREEEEKLSCEDELQKLGLIVPWCGQVEFLSSAALGCFVTHCGWNSTLESLASGVPVVAFPQWTDQGTNAKLVEEVWGTAVRVRAQGKDGVVGREEIKRCLDLVLEGDEFRRNAEKWKSLAREAAKEGGSSDRNLRNFVAEIVREAGCNGQK